MKLHLMYETIIHRIGIFSIKIAVQKLRLQKKGQFKKHML